MKRGEKVKETSKRNREGRKERQKTRKVEGGRGKQIGTYKNKEERKMRKAKREGEES